jgi:hypothetical protein
VAVAPTLIAKMHQLLANPVLTGFVKLPTAVILAQIPINVLELLKDALIALGINVDRLIHQIADHPAAQIINALGHGMGVFTAILAYANVPLKDMLILQAASVTLVA